ncbi:hypothetical protein EB796_015371 [Bugula neritina]|uniref:Uncharacterized protein n=1 Tax=Bugula neritina TaxID=10212 RepID=A0A7J7JJ15_BUGNE|nr:hypothetical protein EB796_015371 [Bugula neritina]
MYLAYLATGKYVTVTWHVEWKDTTTVAGKSSISINSINSISVSTTIKEQTDSVVESQSNLMASYSLSAIFISFIWNYVWI